MSGTETQKWGPQGKLTPGYWWRDAKSGQVYLVRNNAVISLAGPPEAKPPENPHPVYVLNLTTTACEQKPHPEVAADAAQDQGATVYPV